jgi:hypothetical protein
MTDPTVSNIREGLPPCFKGFAEFEGRRASLHQKSLCTFSCTQEGEFLVAPGRIMGRIEGHPHSNWLTGNLGGVLLTDDPAEAQAAFERGAEWVRTGEMA